MGTDALLFNLLAGISAGFNANRFKPLSKEENPMEAHAQVGPPCVASLAKKAAHACDERMLSNAGF